MTIVIEYTRVDDHVFYSQNMTPPKSAVYAAIFSVITKSLL